MDTPLKIGKVEFNSRLLVGTGKYRDVAETEKGMQEKSQEFVEMAKEI